MSTKIEWTDETCNVTVGCSKCSPGCDNCYAERLAARWAKHPNPKIRAKYEDTVDAAGKWTGKISLLDLSPLHRLPRNKPKRIFIGSMTDMFHERGPTFLELSDLWRQMAFLRQHTFMMLTKRPERMLDFCLNRIGDMPPLPNAWLGATICGPDELWKIPVLLQTPAAKRFISVEPMLGPVDLTAIDWSDILDSTSTKNAMTGETYISGNCGESSRTIWGRKLDWVICGGETGPGARPMHPDWVRSLRDQCQAAGTPFFFKGWGEWAWCDTPPAGRYINGLGETKASGPGLYQVGKRRSGRLLDGREWNEVPA